jgi:hypothetical protein
LGSVAAYSEEMVIDMPALFIIKLERGVLPKSEHWDRDRFKSLASATAKSASTAVAETMNQSTEQKM